MLETIVADNGSRFIIAAAAVAIGLVCLVAVLWIIRNRPSSPFIRGGKNRQPRLAVLDAAAVDTRRRLVLIRRDDVEHLIMIGGPTDIVIESRIASGDERPALAERKAAEPTAIASRPAVTEPAPQIAATIQPEVAMEARPAIRPAAIQPAQEIPAVAVVEAPQASFDVAASRPMPAVQPVQAQRPAPAVQQPVPAASPISDFERLLDAEITGDLQRLGPSVAAPESRSVAPVGRQEPLLSAPATDGARREPTIEEEMNRMLADISVGRKP